jgi:hypothetical protein
MAELEASSSLSTPPSMEFVQMRMKLTDKSANIIAETLLPHSASFSYSYI